MTNDELVLKVVNVKKQYRLGVIGGGTLQGDLQSWWARIRGKEDPNSKIGENTSKKSGTFMALQGVSFEVKKGERLGIIGGNGAGKSTTLKILSRVTAPTDGIIYIKGRISSMLEVGTGFHPELTGRENIYLNGAILGMSKNEVDKKIEDIIDFSECRQFIDTPVKRYSSGMYVKLAFSVAAHLDSEILIMDEVLAVGDINFQQKCLKKMRELAEKEDRTILYVSHNMSTIRELCNRCLVLKNGKCIYDGDTETAIDIYANFYQVEFRKKYNLSDIKRISELTNCCRMNEVSLENNHLNCNDFLEFSLKIDSKKNIDNTLLRFVLFDSELKPIGMAYSTLFRLKEGDNKIDFKFDVKNVMNGRYIVDLILCEFKDDIQIRHDLVTRAFSFSVEGSQAFYNMNWNTNGWGHIKFNDIIVKESI